MLGSASDPGLPVSGGEGQLVTASQHSVDTWARMTPGVLPEPESVLHLTGMPKRSSSENGEGTGCNMHARHVPTKMLTGGRHRQVPGVMTAAQGACVA